MEHNVCGKTGMKLSQLSFGASSLGGVFHDIRETEAIQAVFTAIEHGMNFIDVSPYYGNTSCEILSFNESRSVWERWCEYMGLFRETGNRERLRKYGTAAY